MFQEDQNGADEKFVRDLLETPDRRPPVPPDDLTAIRNAARAVWQSRYTDRVRVIRARWMLPVAAALLAGLVLTWWKLSPRPVVEPPGSVAQVDRVYGTVTVSLGDNARPLPVAAGLQVAVGSVIETREAPEESRLALRLIGGQSLRLDRGTRVRFVSPTIAALDHGAVYLDSFGNPSAGEVTIRTADGDFRPIGTQFEVRREEDGTHLRVREGRVSVERPGGTVTATQGDDLTVHRDGTIVRGHLDPDHPSWDWVLEAAPSFEIEGHTLRAFLDWLAREKGWKVKYASEEAASLSNTIILHGSISDLTPDEALRTVTLSSGFDSRVSEGVLIVSAAGGD